MVEINKERWFLCGTLMSRPALLSAVKLHYAPLKVKFKLPKPSTAALPASGYEPTARVLVGSGEFHLHGVCVCALVGDMLPFVCRLTSRSSLVGDQQVGWTTFK